MAVAGWRGANAADLLSAKWFNLSASGAEEAFYNSRAIRGWSGAGALPTAVPLTAGPKVRIQLPPAQSLRTTGSSVRDMNERRYLYRLMLKGETPV